MRHPGARPARIGRRGIAAAPLAAVAAAALLVGCGDTARLAVSDGTGPQPRLPAPVETLIPTVHVAPAKGWPDDGMPRAAAGLRVTRFAESLAHPRWLHVLPDGSVLVAESNAPAKAADAPRGFRDWIATRIMARAGAGVPSPDRIVLLRDADGDGVAEQRMVLLEGLRSPFGMAMVGDALYVAETDALRRFAWRPGAPRPETPGALLAELPAGPVNSHWTKSLLASPDGSRFYIGVGSNSNVGERGLELEQGRAAIWEVDRASGKARVFASGLRNPVGLAWEPSTGALWAAVNERDELGSDLVPDYMTSVRDGGFYGWPWSWFGDHVDERVRPPRPDMVARALVPDYALGPHTASLGLAWSGAGQMRARFGEGMFVGQHGSWNRRPRSGYQVVFVPFAGGRPAGSPQVVLDGFLDEEGNALGRPVGVALDREGGLLVADDVGKSVWRVSAVR
jgi:glucose/arabinose dehydrogenase